MSTVANAPAMQPPATATATATPGNAYNAISSMAIFQPLRNQIEFYFNPNNLCNDHYLLSQLHATEHIGAVPIQVLCHFPKVRQLYAIARFGQHVPIEMAPPADPYFLQMALKESSVVNVSDDGMWVIPHVIPEPRSWASHEVDVAKETTSTVVTSTTDATAPASPSSQTTGSSSIGVPTHPLPFKERNTIILRDVPASATEDTVLEVFASEDCIPKSARPDIGNTWYVKFESEDHAVSALAATKDKTIDGAPIRGHLKSELAKSKEQRPMPPAMPLPPPAPQDRTGSAPLHPQPQAPYYILQPMMSHHSYGYGYVPYGYGVHTMSYGYPMQQRYPYGFVRSQHQPQHSANRAEKPSTPPTSVFVRPNQNNGQQGNGKRRSKRSKNKNNNRNHQNNSGDPSIETSVSHDAQQQEDTSLSNHSRTGGESKGVQAHDNLNAGRKHSKSRGKKNNKKSHDKFDMNPEHFPALGGKNAPEPKILETKFNKPAYAEALLKRTPPPPTNQASQPKPLDTGLEAAMNKLAFSEVGVASYDEW